MKCISSLVKYLEKLHFYNEMQFLSLQEGLKINNINGIFQFQRIEKNEFTLILNISSKHKMRLTSHLSASEWEFEHQRKNFLVFIHG